MEAWLEGDWHEMFPSMMQPDDVIPLMTRSSVECQTDDTTIQTMKKRDPAFNANSPTGDKKKHKNGAEFNNIRKRRNQQRIGIVRVQTEIMRVIGRPLTHHELLVIARLASSMYFLKIDRNATRYKEALMAWCSENFDVFCNVLAYITPEQLDTKGTA